MGEQKHDQYFLRGIVVPKNLKVRWTERSRTPPGYNYPFVNYDGS